MENIVLLTLLATCGVMFLYVLDGKLSEKDRTTGDYIKTTCMIGGGLYLALMNHTVPKEVFKEVIEAGPATF